MGLNNVVSFSGGKDSTAMLLMMLERGEPIHSVVFFDTGWEFPQMYDHLEKFEKYTGVEIVRLYPKKPLNNYLINPTYKWPDSRRRWCTRLKINAVSGFAKKAKAYECIGIASDEPDRLESKMYDGRNVRFPLVEMGIAEADALAMCKAHGFDWGGLYEIFHRVSCYCCPLKSLPEIKSIRLHFPELWKNMLDIENKMPANGGFKGYATVQDLEARFAEDDRQLILPGIAV